MTLFMFTLSRYIGHLMHPKFLMDMMRITKRSLNIRMILDII